MANETPPALTAEQWDAQDYRQTARELDQWAQTRAEAAADDTTEYVAKLGLSASGAVIAMNRAPDRVLVPPPARPALAAFALAHQPIGFTSADVEAVFHAAERTDDVASAGQLRAIAQRLQALIPPPLHPRSP
jgi:hypothetical protein